MFLSEKATNVKESSTLAIMAKAAAMKKNGQKVISLGVGEPDFPTPKHVCDAAIDAINEGFTKYTATPGIVELRGAICDKLKRDNGLSYTADQIVVSNGAKHALTNAFSSILNVNDEVIIPAPYWLSYYEMVNIAGGKAVIAYSSKKNNYKITVAELEKSLTKKSKAIIINSPNNPTGMVYTKSELVEIADFAVKHNLFVISDEIYEKLIYSETEAVSIASLGDEIYKRTIVINGFSKSYSMTGWRVGYAACSKEIASVMTNIQSHGTSGISGISQKAALAALTGDQHCVSEMRDEFRKRRDYIYERIIAIPGFDIIKPEGAFYAFIDISGYCGGSAKFTCENASDFARELLEQKLVAVVPCQDFGYDKFIRLSYAISIRNLESAMDGIAMFVKENF